MQKAAAGIGRSMERYEDIEGMKEILSLAAEFLLPLARESEWPCRPELMGWLTMVRDTLGKKNERDIH